MVCDTIELFRAGRARRKTAEIRRDGENCQEPSRIRDKLRVQHHANRRAYRSLLPTQPLDPKIEWPPGADYDIELVCGRPTYDYTDGAAQNHARASA